MTETYVILGLLVPAATLLACGMWCRRYADRLEKFLDEVYGPHA